jgi:hypothetical protein
MKNLFHQANKLAKEQFNTMIITCGDASKNWETMKGDWEIDHKDKEKA